MKNVIAKKFRCKFDQSDCSDRALWDKKSSARPIWTKSLTKTNAAIVFRKYDVIITISLEFLLRVATAVVAAVEWLAELDLALAVGWLCVSAALFT